jgi:hypothetical protein
MTEPSNGVKFVSVDRLRSFTSTHERDSATDGRTSMSQNANFIMLVAVSIKKQKKNF